MGLPIVLPLEHLMIHYRETNRKISNNILRHIILKKIPSTTNLQKELIPVPCLIPSSSKPDIPLRTNPSKLLLSNSERWLHKIINKI